MSLYTERLASRFVTRIIVGFAVCAITLTVLGMIDVAKDAFGSHKNFADMSISDFRPGDIVYGYISENLGCAATYETTSTRRYSTDTYISGYYYVIPFYASPDDPLPDKVMLYKTGNRQQHTQLEKVFDQTVDRYLYEGYDFSSVFVDRAEVTAMSEDEKRVFREYVDAFIDALYETETSKTRDYIKNSYYEAMVPYLVEFNAGGGYTLLMVGLVMLGILIVGVLIYIAKSRSANDLNSVYVGANDPNLNAPTGLSDASYKNFEPARPPQHVRTGDPGVMLPRQSKSYRTDYSNSQRPMPPMEGLPQQPRLVGYDPQTGQPIYRIDPKDAPEPKPAEKTMDSIDLKNTDLVDFSNNGGIGAEPSQIPEAVPMQTIDPKAAVQSDYDDNVEWQFRNDNAAMPMNGNIPVINTENFEPLQQLSVIPDLPEQIQSDPIAEAFPETTDADFVVQPTDAPTPVTPEPSFTPEPTSTPEPAFTPEPAPAPEPDSYNIFKTDGGSSYNIFKDSSSSMGFPVENKDFPSVDKSFPTTKKDDFNS